MVAAMSDHATDNAPPEPRQRDYTIREAAGLLGIKEPTLRMRVNRGVVHTVIGERRGKEIRVIPHDELMRIRAEEEKRRAASDPDHAPSRNVTPVPPREVTGGADHVVLPAEVLIAKISEQAEELGRLRQIEASVGERERREREAREAVERELHQARAEAMAAQQRAQEAERQAQEADAAAREAAERARALEAELAAAAEAKSDDGAGEAPARPGFWARWFGGGGSTPPDAT